MARGLPSCNYFNTLIAKGHIYPSDRKQGYHIFHRLLHFLFLKVKFLRRFSPLNIFIFRKYVTNSKKKVTISRNSSKK